MIKQTETGNKKPFQARDATQFVESLPSTHKGQVHIPEPQRLRVVASACNPDTRAYTDLVPKKKRRRGRRKRGGEKRGKGVEDGEEEGEKRTRRRGGKKRTEEEKGWRESSGGKVLSLKA